jgi:hypothetical protein
MGSTINKKECREMHNNRENRKRERDRERGREEKQRAVAMRGVIER